MVFLAFVLESVDLTDKPDMVKMSGESFNKDTL